MTKNWTTEEDARLRELYPDLANKEIAAMMGRGENAVRQRAFKLGIRKSAQYLSDCNAGKFQKRNTPHNKGKKLSEFMSPEGQRRVQATQFKKGNVPKKTSQLGDIRTYKGYSAIKIDQPDQWILLHHLVWQVYTRGWFEPLGWLPRNKIIQFRDGNPRNCRFNNLYITDRADLMYRNSGTVNMSDGMVAYFLSGKRGKDKEEIAAFRQNKELIETKRNLMLLNRAIGELRIKN
jgi:hypothetical protein